MLRKFYLFCFLSIVGLFSKNIFAQLPQFYNYNTIIGGNSFPFNNTVNNKVQWIFGPNVFNSAGSTGTPAYPGNITTFYVLPAASSSNTIYTVFSVKMAQNVGVQNAWTNSTFNTGMTTVLGPQTYTVTTTSSGTWLPITLTTPYNYDPNLSLIVEVEQNSYTGTGFTVNQTANGNDRIWGSFGSSAGISFGTGTLHCGFDLVPSSPCAGVPVLGTINTGNLTVCPNQTLSFNLVGLQYGSGLNIQWQESTNGGATWSNANGVSGSTNLSLQTFPLAMTTMYRAYGVCTNSGLSDTTAPVTITVTLPNFASIPYTQDFENWTGYCNTLDVPLSGTLVNWASTPSSGDNSWRRNDQGSSGNWNNPSLSSYIPSSSTGQYSARFHSRNTLLAGDLDLYLDCSQQLGTKTIFFDYINNNTAGGADYLEVLLSTDGGLIYLSQGFFYSSANWQNYSIPLSSNSPNTIVRFEGTGDNLLTTGSDIGIDNINVVYDCIGTPTAGAIVNVTPCPNAVFNLNLTGNILSGGLNYVWESAPSAIGPWTNVGSTTSPVITTQIATPTYFRCIVQCFYSGFADTTPVQLIDVGSFYTCYCGSQSNTLNIVQNIGNVSLRNSQGGLILNNGSALPLLNSSSALHYYSSFFGLTPTVVYRDSAYDYTDTTFSQTAAYTNGYTNVYIDFNRDGSYDPITELVVNGVSNAPSNLTIGSFVVPNNAQYGLTGMRVIYQVGATSTSIYPCGAYANGETEDYIIDISPAPCTIPPSGGTAVISDSFTCPGYTVFLTDTTHDFYFAGLTFNWQISSDGINFVDIPLATLDTLSYTVNATTWFRFRTTCNGTSDGFSNTVYVQMSPTFSCYGNSQAIGGILDTSDIGAFVVTNVSTNTNIYSFVTGGPHLYNSMAVKRRTDNTNFGSMYLYNDSTYKMSVFHILKNGIQADAKVTIFIDYNNNLTYDIPAERVFTGTATATNYYLDAIVHTALSPSMNVPTGLRVVLNNDLSTNAASDDGVGTYTSGETEDYLVNFKLNPVIHPNSIENFGSIKELAIFPNPASTILYIGFSTIEKLDASIKLTTITGSTVLEKKYHAISGNFVSELNVGNISKGVYLLKIDSDKGNYVRRVVIE